jgi:hypothetical protein
MRKLRIEHGYFVPALGNRLAAVKTQYNKKEDALEHDAKWRNITNVLSCYIIDVNDKGKYIKVQTEGIRHVTIEDINFPDMNVTTTDRLFSELIILFENALHPFFAFDFDKDVKYLLHSNGKIERIEHKDKFYERLH